MWSGRYRCRPDWYSKFLGEVEDGANLPRNQVSAGLRRTGKVPRTTNPQILRRLERIILRGFLCALRVLAVSGTARSPRRREGCKENAKNTILVAAWLLRKNPCPMVR